MMSEVILTERLRLRAWRPDDLDALIELFAKPEVWHYPLRRGFTPEETTVFLERQIKAQDNGEIALMAAEDRSSTQLLGYIGLGVPNFLPVVMPAVEIGWRLDPSVWGRGLATEGALAVLAYGFDVLELQSVVSIYEPDNFASGRVMQHLAMQFDRNTVDPARDLPLRVYRLSKSLWVEHSTIR
jgi:RimJ/RimL family protein N-acetyltransferase